MCLKSGAIQAESRKCCLQRTQFNSPFQLATATSNKYTSKSNKYKTNPKQIQYKCKTIKKQIQNYFNTNCNTNCNTNAVSKGHSSIAPSSWHSQPWREKNQTEKIIFVYTTKDKQIQNYILLLKLDNGHAVQIEEEFKQIKSTPLQTKSN